MERSATSGFSKMRAIVFTKYGPPDVLQLRKLPKPIPKENEVLIKIHAVSVTTGDCELRKFKFPIWLWIPLRLVVGVRKPRKRILGMYLAGEIESVGKNVTRFKEGDQIYGCSSFRFGANAEYLCLPESAEITAKPVNLSYEEAAAVPIGGLNALHFMRKGNVRSGEKMLIVGAGGSIGTFAVQFAKLYGAEVTAVDSAGKLTLLSSIGADQVIDYAQEDFTTNGETYDVIFDVVGKSSYSRSLKSLKQNGRYMLGNPKMRQILRSLVQRKNGKRIIFEFAAEKAEDLAYLKKLIEAGKIKPVVDRVFPLHQTVQAHEYVESGRKKGNVLIKVQS